MIALLLWQPALPAPLLALVVLALGTLLALGWRELRARLGPRQAWPIMTARALATLLLGIALVDPACRRPADDATRRRVVLLRDRSGSMQVADDGQASRDARAARIAEQLRAALPASVVVEDWAFDDEVRRDGSAGTNALAGSDLGGALLTAAESAGDVTAILLLSDGGDEPPQPAQLPHAPLAIVAMGSDPAGWRDVAIAQAGAPASAGRGARFTIDVDLLARGVDDAAFRARLARLPVTLARAADDGAWTTVATTVVSLVQGRVRASFETTCDEPGMRAYRVQVAGVPGELSPLNNRRTVRVDIRREAVDVLYFSRRLGADLKMLRQELATDESVTFTALYRVGEGRHTLQAGEGIDATGLEEGLPSAARLRSFDCVIVGSFPATLWTAAEMRALLEYVAEGGGLIWLGGEESFEGGGYGDSPLQPLIPWRLADDAPTLLRGSYPVSLPDAAAAAPAVAGLRELLAESLAGGGEPLALAAVNPPGPLSPAAQTLLEAELPQGRTPCLVAQPYGRGRIYALASNTSWQWARLNGPEARFYRRLWRQLVRAAAGQESDGRLLQVIWDRAELRPAERCGVTLRVTEPEGVTLRATLVGESGALALPLSRGAASDAWRTEVVVRRRGLYTFRVTAERGGELLETYEKRLAVNPAAEEGTRLERRDTELAALAARAGGCYAPEERATAAVTQVAEWCRAAQRLETVTLVSRGPGFFLLLLAALVTEWALRRRRNLV